MAVIVRLELPEIKPGTKANRILAHAMLEFPKTWLTKYRKRHFTERGRSLYGYRKRTRDYTKRKKRLFHHNLPLVFTGRGRADTRGGRAVATHRRAQAIMNAPIFNIRPRGWPYPMREELTRVADSELQEMDRRATTVMEREVQNLANRRTRKVTAR